MSIDVHIYSKLSIIADDLRLFMYLYFGPVVNPTDFAMMIHDSDFMDWIRFYIDIMDYFTSQFIIYESAGVSDVLEGSRVADTTEIARTRCLRDYLKREHNTVDLCPSTRVIIEHQPVKIGSKTNNKSTTVSHQLAFYYIDHNPVFVEPKLKNTIAIRVGLEYATMFASELERVRVRDCARDCARVCASVCTSVCTRVCASDQPEEPKPIKKHKDLKYRVNKMHSKANFIHLVTTFGCEHVIDNVYTSDLDDLADSTMQIFAYLIKNKLFI